MRLVSDTIRDEDLVIFVFMIPKPYCGADAIKMWLRKAGGDKSLTRNTQSCGGLS